MKKSFDYFKTLKDLSAIVCESFDCLPDSKTINKNYLCFVALRNELSENLIDEFVAPIERDDIFKLSFCLCDEFACVMKLCEFLSLSKTDFCESVGQIGDLLHNQQEVFDLKALLKTPQKAFGVVSNELLICKKIKKSILGETRDNISYHNQPLIAYVIGSSCIETVSSVENTYNEICRVLINNS